ncbi:MAG: hypothetical protein ABSH20_27705 [Tepidisphaeraceae bacterium]
MTRSLLISVLAVSLSGAPALAATPQLLTATFVGTPGHDDFQGVCFAPDGTLLVVGNFDQPFTAPAGIPTLMLGKPVADSWYRCGTLMQFSGDGKRLLKVVQFARGLAFLTSVAVSKDGVYLGGYATAEFAGTINEVAGLFATPEQANAAPVPWPLPGDVVKAKEPPLDPAEPKVLTMLSRHHGWKRGYPCVVQMRPELDRLDAATFLEGYHYAWNNQQNLKQDDWTPTAVQIMEDRQVVVGHDGGVPGHYYYAPDYVSRLDAGLKKRSWRFDIFFPPTDPMKVAKYQAQREPRCAEWKVPCFGQTRLLDVKSDGRGAIYACGWSVSATSREPYWTPFLFKLDGDGREVWRAYAPDPMSGKDDRMNGLVADSVIKSLGFADDGQLILAALADGGNTIWTASPADYAKPSQARLKGSWTRVLGAERYKGAVLRINDAREMTGGTYLGTHVKMSPGGKTGWAVGVCGLPGKRVLALGRHTFPYGTTADAWVTDESGPGGFIRVWDENFGDRFITNLPDTIPYALTRKGSRIAAVGAARSEKALVKDAAFPKYNGMLDAYLLVAEFPE